MAGLSTKAESRVLKCLLCARHTLDLLCDSLDLQCHEVRAVLERLEAVGLARPRGSTGLDALAYDLTEEGRREALALFDGEARRLAERGYAPDDVHMLRQLAEGDPGMRPAACEWGVGATRQRLWEGGLITVFGFIRPRATLTPQGRSLLDSLTGAGA
jgi:hypothetical protein